MEAELTALATSGATTLIGLMVSDSWNQIRERVARLLAPDGRTEEALTELDSARNTLLATQETGCELTTVAITAEWRTRLYLLLQLNPNATNELRSMLTPLNDPLRERGQLTVHNVISGGVQHGPVIQSGRINRPTFHITHPLTPEANKQGSET